MSNEPNDKRAPYLQFFCQDWLGDPALRSVSPAAKGLWIDLICIMHSQGTPYGHLSMQLGVPIPGRLVARMLGIDSRTVAKLLQELITASVCSVTDTGVIYSRKLVRMKARTLHFTGIGRKGGNPTLKRALTNSDSVTLNQTLNHDNNHTVGPMVYGTGTGYSSSSGTSPPKFPYEHTKSAVELLEFLSQLTGATFQPTHGAITEVCLRIHGTGGDVQGIRTMLEKQVKLWKNDPLMCRFLRPSTLFSEEKFPEYFAQRNLAEIVPASPGVTAGALQGRLRELDARLRELDAASDDDAVSKRRAVRVERDKLSEKIKAMIGE